MMKLIKTATSALLVRHSLPISCYLCLCTTTRSSASRVLSPRSTLPWVLSSPRCHTRRRRPAPNTAPLSGSCWTLPPLQDSRWQGAILGRCPAPRQRQLGGSTGARKLQLLCWGHAGGHSSWRLRAQGHGSYLCSLPLKSMVCCFAWLSFLPPGLCQTKLTRGVIICVSC